MAKGFIMFMFTSKPAVRRSATPRRVTALRAIGATALVGATSVAAAGPASATSHRLEAALPTERQFAGPLRDLQPASGDPLDGAAGRVIMVQSRAATTFVLMLTGVGAGAVGRTYGAHLHTGPCVAGNGAAAGAHYNQSTVNGVVPPVVSDRTEVWLDVTIRPGGGAVAVARVPFVPLPGAHSVVLHAQATDDHGTAGARLACLPVSWS